MTRVLGCHSKFVKENFGNNPATFTAAKNGDSIRGDLGLEKSVLCRSKLLRHNETRQQENGRATEKQGGG